ncbi:uncharacterized protein EI90DRAFT_3034185 [Cantharellus anzutake]|uniref:uncharacterized protein n=1 Tax=Cantharellus anzutake TaxID=1750568 RepID=UPI00190845DA|nr:uncharacterized protein EI90DRAFT_3034185 [Cantharellus anzutake]KAF8341517.1 hypothetical protein EI90DRAFT_3034185 [Cantharellus anzutake]
MPSTSDQDAATDHPTDQKLQTSPHPPATDTAELTTETGGSNATDPAHAGIQGQTHENAAHTGSRLGDTLRGAWNVFHGTGEVVRGNINKLVDDTGDVISQRKSKDEKPASRSGQTGESIVARGASEFSKGLEQLRGHHDGSASGNK